MDPSTVHQDLLDFLAGLPDSADPRERKNLVIAAGCGHLVDRIDFRGAPRAVYGQVLEVLAADGQETLVGFLASLPRTAGLGPDDAAPVAELLLALEARGC